MRQKSCHNTRCVLPFSSFLALCDITDAIYWRCLPITWVVLPVWCRASLLSSYMYHNTVSRMFPKYSSTVLIKYCTYKALWKNYRELLLEFYSIFTFLNSYSLFKLFKYPPVQTAIVHTVQHWQVFTKVEQRHPRHLILFFFFSTGKLHTPLLFCCLLPKSTKMLKAF